LWGSAAEDFEAESTPTAESLTGRLTTASTADQRAGNPTAASAFYSQMRTAGLRSRQVLPTATVLKR
jgi:hypothetical protein